MTEPQACQDRSHDRAKDGLERCGRQVPSNPEERTCKSAAKALGRTPVAVQQKAMRSGISFRLPSHVAATLTYRSPQIDRVFRYVSFEEEAEIEARGARIAMTERRYSHLATDDLLHSPLATRPADAVDFIPLVARSPALRVNTHRGGSWRSGNHARPARGACAPPPGPFLPVRSAPHRS